MLPHGTGRKIANKLEKLLDETPESYYWIGFLMADGHIAPRKRLTLALATKDRGHLEKFAKFIDYNQVVQRKTAYWLEVMDKDKLTKVVEKFDFKERKTYNPPNITIEDNNLFLAFLIGYVDGDGYIGKQTGRQDCSLRIKCHASWKDTLSVWFDRLYVLAGIETLNKASTNKTKIKINKQGYTSVMTGNQKILAFLKKATIDLNLPVLKRKWDQVSLEYSDRYSNSKILKTSILELEASGLSRKEIAVKLDICQPYISIIVNRKRT